MRHQGKLSNIISNKKIITYKNPTHAIGWKPAMEGAFENDRKFRLLRI